MALSLPDRPAQHFIDSVLLPGWRSADAHGYELAGVQPGDEAFVPVATTIDTVGEVFPSLVVQYSNETSGGQSTYDFLTTEGPGQDRQGTLLATARAQDAASGYTGDAAQYAALDADDIVVRLVEAVEAVCQRAATGGDSAFQTIGSQRGPDVPADLNADPPVRIAQTEIRYSWQRRP